LGGGLKRYLFIAFWYVCHDTGTKAPRNSSVVLDCVADPKPIARSSSRFPSYHEARQTVALRCFLRWHCNSRQKCRLFGKQRGIPSVFTRLPSPRASAAMKRLPSSVSVAVVGGFDDAALTAYKVLMNLSLNIAVMTAIAYGLLASTRVGERTDATHIHAFYVAKWSSHFCQQNRGYIYFLDCPPTIDWD